MSLRVPIADRDHLHDPLNADTGSVGAPEQWKFTRVGDVEALGRYQDMGETQDLGWAFMGGLKLPTGTRSVVNSEAEMTRQSQADAMAHITRRATEHMNEIKKLMQPK